MLSKEVVYTYLKQFLYIERNKQKIIASAPVGEYNVPKDTSYKKEISNQYTVAIGYNKGAYQVIPNSDLKHIGK